MKMQDVTTKTERQFNKNREINMDFEVEKMLLLSQLNNVIFQSNNERPKSKTVQFLSPTCSDKPKEDDHSTPTYFNYENSFNSPVNKIVLIMKILLIAFASGITPLPIQAAVPQAFPPDWPPAPTWAAKRRP